MASEPTTRTAKAFLVVKASGDMRVVKKRPYLSLDEVAFPVTVVIPITWGKVQSTTISVTMPEPPEALVSVGDPELGNE